MNILISLLDDPNPDVRLISAEYLNDHTPFATRTDEDEAMDRVSRLLLEATPPQCSWYLTYRFFDPISECHAEITDMSLFQRAAKVVLEGGYRGSTQITAAKKVLELQGQITDPALIQLAKTALQ
ncbi:MAG: hypothetical protein LBD15_00110 [Holosporales bacterium]|jgi:hypothetical protein|nr:hypothetical protein [Holosporales bacterium]